MIFPTMFDYVKSKDGKEWLYGLTLAAFSISNLVTAPLYGLLFDKTHKTKYIVFFANFFEIGGEMCGIALNHVDVPSNSLQGTSCTSLLPLNMLYLGADL